MLLREMLQTERGEREREREREERERSKNESLSRTLKIGCLSTNNCGHSDGGVKMRTRHISEAVDERDSRKSSHKWCHYRRMRYTNSIKEKSMVKITYSRDST
jgi:hypothetical protein